MLIALQFTDNILINKRGDKYHENSRRLQRNAIRHTFFNA